MIFIFLLVLSLNKSSSNGKLLIAISPLLLITLIRYGVGADYFSYNYIYTSTLNKTISQSFAVFPNIDKGFFLIMRLFQFIGASYPIFIGFISAFILIIIMLWLKDNSSNPVLSLFLFFAMFFFVWNLSAIRQGLVLSLSLYLVFNKKFQFNKVVKILIVLALATLHSSALLLLVFIYIDQVHLTKKFHLFLLLLSLISMFLPLENIISYFTFIHGVERLLHYFSDINGFFHFSAISRLVLYAVVWFHYDELLKQDESNKNLVDIYLIGLVIYFFMSFSEVAAGRFGIYSLVLLLLIYPNIVELYRDNIKLYRLAFVGLILFAGLFFNKELNTLVNQTGLILNNSKLIPMTTLLNRDDYLFEDYHYVLLKNTEEFTNEYEKFMGDKNFNNLGLVEAKSEDSFVAVQSAKTNTYLILNNKGERITEATFSFEPKVYKHYLKYYQDETTKEMNYYDLVEKKNISDPEIISQIDQAQRIELKPINIKTVELTDFNSDIQDLVISASDTSNSELRTYVTPLDYSLLFTDYFYGRIVMVLDAEQKLLIDDYYYSASRFDANGFFQLESQATIDIYYKDGKKIWMVLK